jgi:hypothetical protein
VSRRWSEIGARLRLVWEQRSPSRWLVRQATRRGLGGFGGVALFVGRYRLGSIDHDRLDLMAVFRDDTVELTSSDPNGSDLVISMPGRQVIERLDLLGQLIRHNDDSGCLEMSRSDRDSRRSAPAT